MDIYLGMKEIAMHVSPGQEYAHAETVAPHPDSVDWKNRPLPFKLYHDAEQIQLPVCREQTQTLLPGRTLTIAQIGQILLDICGLSHQLHKLWDEAEDGKL